MCSVARIKPAVLQCESHPYLIQNELINHIKRYDIVCRCPLFLILVYSRNTVLDLEKKVSYLWELLLHALARSTYGIIRHWRRSGIFIVNFEHISHLVLVFLLLTLSM